jgi:mannose-6-phosphate isomerase-like protein (cupin superfamily)
MIKCNKNQTIEHQNSDHCIVAEYPIGDKEINFTIAKVSSRYPETGLASNTLCKEIVYIQDGNGKIVVNDAEHILQTGDAVLISPNEKFYWDGNMTLHIACTPAFTPEQHVHIK